MPAIISVIAGMARSYGQNNINASSLMSGNRYAMNLGNDSQREKEFGMKIIETLKISCLVAMALALSTVDLAASILTLGFLRNHEDEEADTEAGGGMG